MTTERIGIKRQVDKLGRIVIPKEYREFYHLGVTVDIRTSPETAKFRHLSACCS